MKQNNCFGKKIFYGIIFLAIAFLFTYYIYKNISDFKQIFSVATNLGNVIFILIIAFFFFSSLFLNGLLLEILMHPFGLRLKFKEWLGLGIITNFYNFITPFRGGMAVRALYLKKKYDFAIIHFLATLSAIYIIIFLIGSFAGLISMLLIRHYYNLFNLPLFWLFLSILLFLLGIIIFSPKLPESGNKWLNKFIKIINGWHLVKNNKRIILATIFFSIIQLILGALTFIIAYYIFGINLSFVKALFISSIGSIAILISLTPGNLGIGDAINVFSAKLIGIGLIEAIAVTVLIRAVNLLLVFILGPIFSYILLKHKPRSLNGG